MSNTRKYVIFNTSELSTIDFNQVLITSADTVQTTADGTKTYVKYENDMPSSVIALTTKQGPYTHSEILNILAGPEWFVNVPN
jgi:hypothetical protein